MQEQHDHRDAGAQHDQRSTALARQQVQQGAEQPQRRSGNNTPKPEPGAARQHGSRSEGAQEMTKQRKHFAPQRRKEVNRKQGKRSKSKTAI